MTYMLRSDPNRTQSQTPRDTRDSRPHQPGGFALVLLGRVSARAAAGCTCS